MNVSVEDIRYVQYLLGVLALWAIKTVGQEAVIFVKRIIYKEEKQEDKISDLVTTLHRLDERFQHMATQMKEIQEDQLTLSDVKTIVRDEFDYIERLQSQRKGQR